MLELPPDFDREGQLLDLDRADCEESLHCFLQGAWKQIDPAPFRDNWHIDAIAEHLEAVVDGQIRRLIINMPPRHCKSLLLSVAFPAWVWAQSTLGPISGPGVPFLYASYADKLSLRDSVKCRRLIESKWFQSRWGNRFALTSDQNTKTRFTNDKGGERLITSIKGGTTGEGGNCFVSGTAVDTPVGRVPIEKLKSGDQVYSFDIQQGMVVTSRVLATAKRTSNDLCALREVSGCGFTCTRDHRIYSPGRGFVRASEMGAADRVLLSGKTVQRPDEKCPPAHLRQMRKADGASTVLGSEGTQTEQPRRLLFRDLFPSASRRQKLAQRMQSLREDAYSKGKKILFLNVQTGAGELVPKGATHLQKLWHRISALRSWKTILLKRVRRCSPCKAYEWLWKFSVSSSGMSLFKPVSISSTFDTRAGWPSLRFLRNETSKASHSSYRRKPAEQSSGESDNALLQLSSETPSWEVGYVTGVSVLGSESVSVYDIQVEGYSNFFAEGILVHNCIIIDDPNSANDVSSETELQNTIDWWSTTMPSRPNDPETCAWIIIQQRLAENDLTGHILEHEADGWVHLCLPGRYEPERSFHTVIGWKDPRTEPGELLWPDRFNEEALRRLEVSMGPYTFAGQIMQRPEPKGGGIIKREYWKLWEHDSYPPMDFVLATLDTAYTLDTLNDESGMIVWGIFSGDVKAATTRIVASDGTPHRMNSTYSEFAPHVMCMYGWADHLELHELVEKVAQTCVKLKVDLLIIENKAAGISVSQEIRRLYWRERFGVELFDPKSQDKAARLYSVQHLFAEGIIYGPDRPWMEKIITQVAQFPKGKRDEYVDLTSMGLRKLRDMGLLIRQPEREAENESQKIYPRGQDAPLYPV